MTTALKTEIQARINAATIANTSTELGLLRLTGAELGCDLTQLDIVALALADSNANGVSLIELAKRVRAQPLAQNDSGVSHPAVGSCVFMGPSIAPLYQPAGANYLRAGYLTQDNSLFDSSVFSASRAVLPVDLNAAPYTSVGDITPYHFGGFREFNGAIIGAGAGKIIRSTDGGGSFQDVATFAGFALAVEVVPLLGRIFVLAHSALTMRIYHSADGTTWTEAAFTVAYNEASCRGGIDVETGDVVVITNRTNSDGTYRRYIYCALYADGYVSPSSLTLGGTSNGYTNTDNKGIAISAGFVVVSLIASSSELTFLYSRVGKALTSLGTSNNYSTGAAVPVFRFLTPTILCVGYATTVFLMPIRDGAIARDPLNIVLLDSGFTVLDCIPAPDQGLIVLGWNTTSKQFCSLVMYPHKSMHGYRLSFDYTGPEAMAGNFTGPLSLVGEDLTMFSRLAKKTRLKFRFAAAAGGAVSASSGDCVQYVRIK